MKKTVVGDVHIIVSSIDKWKKLVEKLEALGHPVVLLGDQLDTKAVIDGWCLNQLYLSLKNSALSWDIIVGNHDLFVLSENEHHSMEVLKSLPNVRVIDRVTAEGNIYYMPYIHDKDELLREIAKIPKGATLLGHFEIPGFDYGNGHICTSGVPETSFKKFSLVISGHFHKHQRKGNVVYMGTPYSKDFGESNQDKFIGVWDTATNEIEYMETGFPKHRTIRVDLSKEAMPEIDPGQDSVRVVLKGTAEQIAKVERVAGVRFDEDPVDAVDVVVSEADDPITQFKTWAAAKNVKDSATELGISILREVSR